MANADFSREQNQTPGGFDSGSYREAKRPDTEAVRLTPLQQKLAGLEKALPTAMAKQGTALVLSVAVMLAAFVGFGGAKVRGKYNEARQWFTTGVSADNGYALSEELTTVPTRRQISSPPAQTRWGPTAPRCRPHRQRWMISLPAWKRCRTAAKSSP